MPATALDPTRSLQPPRLLRLALLGDAAASGATGLLMAAGAGPLAPLLGVPESLLRGAGLVLLPYAAAVAWLGTRPTPGRGAVRAVVALNLLWAAECVLLLALRLAAPTGLGVAFVLLQAAVVLGFALAQWTGLRQAATAAVPA